MAMTTLSFTECWKQSEATNQEIENGETIVTTESTSENDNSEVTSTEVIGGTEKTDTGGFAGAENEDNLLNAEKSIAQYVGQENATFESFDATGTGWIYLEKGEAEASAASNLASAAMGDSVGNPWTDY